MIAQVGIKNLTMDGLAKNLGISKKTIYIHFENKDTLIEFIVNQKLEDNQLICKKILTKSENTIHAFFLMMDISQELYQHINPLFYEELQKYYPNLFDNILIHKKKFLYDMVFNDIKKGIKEGMFRENIEIDIITKFCLESNLLIFNPKIFPSNVYSFKTIHNSLLELYMYGLATPLGQKYIKKYKSI